MSVIGEVMGERLRQNRLWGAENDDKNSLHDWAAYVVRYLGRAVGENAPLAERREALVQVAALAVAAVESLDREYGGPVCKNLE